MTETTKTKSYLQLGLVILIWGSSFTVTKTAVQEIPPLTFALLRHLVASVVLLPFLLKSKAPGAFLKANFWPVLGLALTGITLYYLCFNVAMRHTTASAGAMIQGFIPAAVILMAVIFLKERISRWQLAGVILGIAGVVIMALGGEPLSGAPSPLLGNVLVLASVFCWASYTIIAKKVAQVETMTLMACMTLLGTLLLLPVVAIELQDQPLPHISLKVGAIVVYMGVVASALSYYWYSNILKVLPAATVGLFLNLDPVVGALMAILVLGEPILAMQLFGALVVLVGVGVSLRKN